MSVLFDNGAPTLALVAFAPQLEQPNRLLVLNKQRNMQRRRTVTLIQTL